VRKSNLVLNEPIADEQFALNALDLPDDVRIIREDVHGRPESLRKVALPDRPHGVYLPSEVAHVLRNEQQNLDLPMDPVPVPRVTTMPSANSNSVQSVVPSAISTGGVRSNRLFWIIPAAIAVLLSALCIVLRARIMMLRSKSCSRT